MHTQNQRNARERNTRTAARCVLAVALAVAWPAVQQSAVGAAPLTSPPRVLIVDESVGNGTNSVEAIAAQLAIPNCAIDLVSGTNWYAVPPTGTGGPTGYGLENYRAVIWGDPIGNWATAGYMAGLAEMATNTAGWTPALNGNIIIMGVDNTLHALYGANNAGASNTITRGIAFAVADTNRTGFYYSMSSYYDWVGTNPVVVPHLAGFGNFLTRSYGAQVCFNATHIVATHPVFTNAPPMTDADLSNWGCSTHEGFNAWPPNFVVLAIALTNGVYTAGDGTVGVPYIVVRGTGVNVISSITLGPTAATNNLGTTHTVCATIATNVNPRVGVPVTFTIFSGPNAVTNYTANTDANGTACFTYTGLGGLGTDYITASYQNNNDKTITSGVVAKTWAPACLALGCESLECLGEGQWSYRFCVTNFSGSPVAAVSLANPPPGITISNSVINLSPALNLGQRTNLSVVITSPAGATNVCFSLGATPAGAGGQPCSTPHCLTLPVCCNRIVTNSLTFVSSSGLTNIYNLQMTVQNISGDTVKYALLAAEQTCVRFIPPMLNLTLPAYGGPSPLLPGQSRTFTVQVQKTAPCPGSNAVYLAMLTSNQVACCSTRFTLPGPRCVTLGLPYNGMVAVTNMPFALRAIPNTSPVVGPCPFGMVLFYQDATVVGAADHDPYEVTVVVPTAGTYTFEAVVTYASGEVETSEPAEVFVVAPDAADHQGTP